MVRDGKGRRTRDPYHDAMYPSKSPLWSRREEPPDPRASLTSFESSSRFEQSASFYDDDGPSNYLRRSQDTSPLRRSAKDAWKRYGSSASREHYDPKTNTGDYSHTSLDPAADARRAARWRRDHPDFSYDPELLSPAGVTRHFDKYKGDRGAAAEFIQAAWKSYKAKKGYLRKKKQMEKTYKYRRYYGSRFSKHDEAALAIQSAWRGRKSRMYYKQIRAQQGLKDAYEADRERRWRRIHGRDTAWGEIDDTDALQAWEKDPDDLMMDRMLREQRMDREQEERAERELQKKVDMRMSGRKGPKRSASKPAYEESSPTRGGLSRPRSAARSSNIDHRGGGYYTGLGGFQTDEDFRPERARDRGSYKQEVGVEDKLGREWSSGSSTSAKKKVKGAIKSVGKAALKAKTGRTGAFGDVTEKVMTATKRREIQKAKKAEAAKAAAKQRKANEARALYFRHLIDFIQSTILEPVLSNAIKLGDFVLVARDYQKKYENRPVTKSHIVAQALATATLRGVSKIPPTLGVLPGCGRCVVTDGGKVSMYDYTTGQQLPPIELKPPNAIEPVHSVVSDPGSSIVFVFTTTGRLQIWDGVMATLQHDIHVTTISPREVKLLPKSNLLFCDSHTACVGLNTTFIDGKIRFFEPISGRLMGEIIPKEIEFSEESVKRKAQVIKHQVVEFVTLLRHNLVVCSLENSGCIKIFSSTTGAHVADMKGHFGCPPKLSFLPEVMCVVSGGTGGDSWKGSDYSVRVWSIGENIRPSKEKVLDLNPQVVMEGHQGPIADVCYLPNARLIATSSHDRTVRLWDPSACPYGLSEPGGSSHVRIHPGYYEPMEKEWTKTNTPFCCCKVVATTPDVFVGLKAASHQLGSEVLLGVSAHEKATTLSFWAVGRKNYQVAANRFDEPPSSDVVQYLDRAFLKTWQERIREFQHHLLGNVKGLLTKGYDYDHTVASMKVLLQEAWLQRQSVSHVLREGPLKEVYQLALDMKHRVLLKARNSVHVREKFETLSADEIFLILQEAAPMCLLNHDAKGFFHMVQEIDQYLALKARKNDGTELLEPQMKLEFPPPRIALSLPNKTPEQITKRTWEMNETDLMQKYSKKIHKRLKKSVKSLHPLPRGTERIATELRFGRWHQQLESVATHLNQLKKALRDKLDININGDRTLRDGTEVTPKLFVQLINEIDPISSIRENSLDINNIVLQLRHNLRNARGVIVPAAYNVVHKWQTKLVDFQDNLNALKARIQGRKLNLMCQKANEKVMSKLPEPDIPHRKDISDDIALQQQMEDELVRSFRVNMDDELVERSDWMRKTYEGYDDDRRQLIAVTVIQAADMHTESEDGKPYLYYFNDCEVDTRQRHYKNDLFAKYYGCQDIRPEGKGISVGDPSQSKNRYIFSERLEGWKSLKDLIFHHGAMKSPENLSVVRYWGSKILQALSGLHLTNVILRNLSSESVYISPDGLNVKIVDLSQVGKLNDRGHFKWGPETDPREKYYLQTWDVDGNVVVIEDKHGKSNEVIHEPPKSSEYIPPERILQNKQAWTEKYDMWAFGVLLYEMIFGRPPPSFLDTAEKYRNFRRLATIRAVGDSFHYDIVCGPKKKKLTKPGQSEMSKDKEEREPPEDAWFDIASKFSLGLLPPMNEQQRKKREAEEKAAKEKGIGDRLMEEEVSELSFLDIMLFCVQKDPTLRPQSTRLLELPLFKMTPSEIANAKRNASTYIRSLDPEIEVQESFIRPILQMYTELEEKGGLDMSTFSVVSELFGRKVSGNMNDVRQDVIGHDVDLSDLSIPVEVSYTIRLTRELFRHRILQMLVILALRFFSECSSTKKRKTKKKKVEGEKRLQNNPKDGEEAIRGILTLMQGMFYELHEQKSYVSAYVGALLDNLIRLYVGEEHWKGEDDVGVLLVRSVSTSKVFGPGEVKAARKLIRLTKDSHWRPRLMDLTNSLVLDVLTEEGSGNPAYPVVRDFLLGSNGSNRFYNADAPNDWLSSRLARSPQYFSQVLQLADNVLRSHNRKNRRVRRSGVIQMTSTIQKRQPEHLRLVLDFNVGEKLIPLLDDQDADVRLEAFSFYLELAKLMPAVGKATKRSHDGWEEAKADSINGLMEIFHSFPLTSALMQHMRAGRPDDGPQAKATIIRVFRHSMRGGEKVARAWLVCDVFHALAELLNEANFHPSFAKVLARQKKEMPTRDLFLDIFSTGNPYILQALTNTPGLGATLRGHGIETLLPPSLKSLFRTLSELKSGVIISADAMTAFIDNLRTIFYHYEYLGEEDKKELQTYDNFPEILEFVLDFFSQCWSLCQDYPRSPAEEEMVQQRVDLLVKVLDVLRLLMRSKFREQCLTAGVVEFTVKKAEEKQLFNAHKIHPLVPVYVQLAQFVQDIVEMQDPKIVEALINVDFGHVFANTVARQYEIYRVCVKSRTSEHHLRGRYPPEATFRLTTWAEVLKTNDDQILDQLLKAGFLERIVRENLGDTCDFDIQHVRLPLAFLKFNTTFPLRWEAIEIIRRVCQHQEECPAMMRDLIRLLRRYRVVEAETQRLIVFKEKELQASVITFFKVLNDANHQRIDEWIIEGCVLDEITKLFKAASEAEKFANVKKCPITMAATDLFKNLNETLKEEVDRESSGGSASLKKLMAKEKEKQKKVDAKRTARKSRK